MYQDHSIYHVYNRGAHRQKIFTTDFQFEYCLGIMDKYRPKYGVAILAYCLMPNHFHLILQQHESGTISRFMQTTFNAYVQAFNKMERHDGTIFQGASKRIWVETDPQAMQLVRYIHYNPVAAGLVQHPDDWRYSDFPEWIGERQFRFDGKTLFERYFTQPSEYAGSMKEYQAEKEMQKIGMLLLD